MVKVYNVALTTVALVYGEDEQDATARYAQHLSRGLDLEVLPPGIGDGTFESEPGPEEHVLDLPPVKKKG